MELREHFAGADDLALLWVMPDSQINDKTHRFIDSLGLRQRVRFAVDPASAAIDRLGIRLAPAEPLEQGVPHPTTLLLDADGVVRFVDVRRDYHAWLDPALLGEALAALR